MHFLTLLMVYLCHIWIAKASDEYDDGQYIANQVVDVSWTYSPTTYISWYGTVTVTIITTVPCPVTTTYTTSTVCQACGGCATCPYKVVDVQTDGLNEVSTVTAAYQPGESVIIVTNGQTITTPASACCAFTFTSNGGSCPTCPYKVVDVQTDGLNEVSTVTAAYQPGEQVTIITNGQAIATPASACCAFTFATNDDDPPNPDPNPDTPAAGVITTPYYSYTARGSVYVVWTTVTPGAQGLQLQGAGSRIAMEWLSVYLVLRLWIGLALISGVGMLIL